MFRSVDRHRLLQLPKIKIPIRRFRRMRFDLKRRYIWRDVSGGRGQRLEIDLLRALITQSIQHQTLEINIETVLSLCT
ncbi:unnamed protein product [Lactuca virosa]|uniref:Uncharacterized protein n=1 Tax=Lactuca virosa TaxID=75947 RepID=A0AAU9MVF8_9ASTR|nr:unnamed protein product [Lactuca virosa]